MNDTNQTQPDTPRPWESLIPVLAALVVYVYTLPPSISGEDSGELVAAAYTFGIPHPTGYPLWTLLAGSFIRIFAFGDIAWRAALMSALFGAVTVGVVHRFIMELTRNRWAAIAGALALAFSREFWEQSVIAEVYTLNAFFTVLCLYLAYRYHLSPSNNRIAYLLVFLYSLSLSNHSTMFLIGPVFALSILASNPATIRTPRIIVTFCVLFLLGLSVHLYLPIRSLANPPMDWGNPENWSNFLSVITREQYQGIITDNPRSISRFLWQCGVFAKQYAWEFTPWVGWLPIAGVILIWRQPNRHAAANLTAVGFIVALAAILVPNFGPTYREIWLNSTYYIPVYVVAAILLGIALSAAMDRFRPPVFFRAIALTLVTLSPMLVHFSHNNMRDYHFSRDYAYNLLGTMAPDAIYFGSGDHTLFPLVYLQVVEGLRPDVTLANQYGYPDTDLLAQMPTPPSKLPPTEGDERRLFAWLMENAERPVYSVVERPPGSRIAVREGLLYRYVKPGESVDQDAPWELYQWHDNTTDFYRTNGDWTAEFVLFEHHYALLEKMLQQKNMEMIRNLRYELLERINEDPSALNNVGVLFAKYGHYQEAVHLFERVLARHPERLSALLNFAKVRLKQNRPEEALELAERALTVKADSDPAQRLKERALRRLSSTQGSEN